MGERERKFAKSKFTNISAKQARDAVSEAIRGNQLNSVRSCLIKPTFLLITYDSSQNCPKLTEPLDYENFVVRNRTILENDGHRDLVLFPRDDIAVRKKLQFLMS